MLMLRVLLCVALVAVLAPQQSEAWGRFRLRLVRIAFRYVIRRCFIKKDCFSRPAIAQYCEGIHKAMIKREEWGALQAREEEVNGIADTVVVHQTGHGTCNVIGLSADNCQRCLQEESCVKELILAIQNNDLKKGKDDISYNFLIGQDGVIYEGRGWDYVGQHTDGHDMKSIGVAMIGDFSKSEPSEAQRAALKNLMSCGEAVGAITHDYSIATEPTLSGEAFDEMVRRCHGLCVD